MLSATRTAPASIPGEASQSSSSASTHSNATSNSMTQLNEPTAAAANTANAATIVTGSGVVYKVSDVGVYFSREYYTTMSRNPAGLFTYYCKTSTLLHGDEGDMDAPVCCGQEDIHRRVTSLGYEGGRVIITGIDSQPTLNGGIIIVTIGEMIMRDGKSRKFTQTFLLVEQAAGFYILNDILRFMTVESLPEREKPFTAAEPVEKKAAAPVAAPVAAAAAPPAAAPAVTPVKQQPHVEKEAAAAVATPAEKRSAQPAATESAAAAPSATAAAAKPAAAPKKTTSAAAAAAAAAAAKPVEEEPVPTGPSSWVQLAAGQQNRWRSGVVAQSKGPVVSIPAEEPAAANNNANRGASRRDNGRNSGSGNRPRRDNAAEPSHQQSSGAHKEDSANHEGQSSRGPRRDAPAKPPVDLEASLFVPGVKSTTDVEQLRAEFAKFGELKKFDVNTSKECAFVEYAGAAMAKAALAATIVVGEATFKSEARRPPRFHNRASGTSNGSNASSRRSRD